jgi:hypothetical protein
MKAPVTLGLSIQTSAAVAAVTKPATTPSPVLGSFLGYQFEWGPMIAGLLTCIAVRFYVAKKLSAIDGPVLTIVMLFTAGLIQDRRPAPIWAIVIGTGLGAIGAGVIKAAQFYVERSLPGVFSDDPPKP